MPRKKMSRAKGDGGRVRVDLQIRVRHDVRKSLTTKKIGGGQLRWEKRVLLALYCKSWAGGKKQTRVPYHRGRFWGHMKFILLLCAKREGFGGKGRISIKKGRALVRMDRRDREPSRGLLVKLFFAPPSGKRALSLSSGSGRKNVKSPLVGVK